MTVSGPRIGTERFGTSTGFSGAEGPLPEVPEELQPVLEGGYALL